MTLLLAALINGEPLEVVLAPDWPMLLVLDSTVDVHPEIHEVVYGSFHNEPPVILGSGYVVKSLEAALWAFARSDDFATAVLAAVNLGDDADTTGAACGQLAGACWGASGIPDELLNGLTKRAMIESAANRLIEEQAH